MALPTTRNYTIDEFEVFIAAPENRERRFELIDGMIIEKTMPTDEHSVIAGLIIYYLADYAMKHGLGVPGPEHRFRVPGDPKNTRVPDVSMIIDPDVPLTIKGATPQPPDFIAEVKSPDDSNDDLRDRARYYISNGVRLVWLVFPREKIVEVYRPDIPSEMLTIEDTLAGGDLLPEFSLPAAKLFTGRRGG